MKIDKLVICEAANAVISLTRGGLGLWNLETGILEFKIADNAGGKAPPVTRAWSYLLEVFCSILVFFKGM